MASQRIQASSGSETFSVASGDGSLRIDGFAFGSDRLEIETDGDYRPWATQAIEDGTAGTKVIHGWGYEDYVFLAGIDDASIEDMLQPTGGSEGDPGADASAGVSHAFTYGDGTQTIEDFAVGSDRLSFTTEGGYAPWAEAATIDGIAGTKVTYGWHYEDYVFLPGVEDVDVAVLLGGQDDDADAASSAGSASGFPGKATDGEASPYDFTYGDGSSTLEGFDVGIDHLSFVTEGGYAPWTEEVTLDGVVGTKVIYGWHYADYVFLPGVTGTTVSDLLGDSDAVEGTDGSQVPDPGSDTSGSAADGDGDGEAEAVNILIRGQSNAYLFVSEGGAAELERQLEEKLGVDVRILASYDDPEGRNTINSGSAFLDWDTDGKQQGLVSYLESLPEEVRDDPTITVWLHNESDQSGDFSSSEWEVEVRADAELVRDALGQDADTTPYSFTYVPYPYGDNGDEIREGMANLAEDDGFNAEMGADLGDLAMDGGPEEGSGGSHMGDGDVMTAADRLADSLSDKVAALAGVDDGNGEAGGAAAGPADGTGSSDGGEVGGTDPGGDATTADGSDGFTVVLSDDFSDGYRTENWGQPYDGSTYWNGAWSWSAEDVNVADGEMQITVTRQEDGSWTSGGFNSLSAGNAITYGKVEFDARVEESQGTMTAILMWPDSDQWPQDGEIDIVETPGEDVMHTLHWGGGEDGTQDTYDSVRNQAYDETEWNHYVMTWLPGELTIEVNGEVVAYWEGEEVPDTAMGFGAMGYVAADYEQWVGGAPDATTPDTTTIHIDNVVMSQWDGAF